MKITKPKKLTASQLEIIRFLGRGCEIYNGPRDKWYLTPIYKLDGGIKKAHTGHTQEKNYVDSLGTHLYRPTVVFFQEAKIIEPIPDVLTRNKSRYRLVSTHPDYQDQIDEAVLEGALGVTRQPKKKK